MRAIGDERYAEVGRLAAWHRAVRPADGLRARQDGLVEQILREQGRWWCEEDGPVGQDGLF